jgi:Polyketide cyclase / dehydrase and lipid transport
MRKTLLIALGVVGVLVIAFVAFVALQPSRFRVTRKTTISAPAPVVFAQVNDFHNWQAWSPWAKLDPTAKNSFEGPTAGPDAVFRWSGNDQIGEGSMTIKESRPSELIKIELEFIRPMTGTSDVEFDFEPVGEQTAVTWSMTGEHNFIGKAVCLFMNMDKTVGGDFEKGLALLKTAAESKVQQPAADEATADQ